MRRFNKIIFVYLFIFVMFMGVSFAWYVWQGDEVNVDVNFADLDPYIKYSSTKVSGGNLTASEDYTGGISNDITFNKESNGDNLKVYGNIYLKVTSANSDDLFKASNLKWTLVSVDENSIEKEISTGNFVGEEVFPSNGSIDNMIPANINFELTKANDKTTYKVYVWLDKNAPVNADISSQDISVETYAEANTEGNFETGYIREIQYSSGKITKFSAYSSLKNITGYMITNSSDIPSIDSTDWIDATGVESSSEQGYILSKSIEQQMNAVNNVCIKNDNNKVYCKSIVNQTSDMPTTTLCTNPEYNGTDQVLVSSTGNEKYSLSNYVGKDAGNYDVVAKLKDGYTWEDGTNDNITFKCSIKQKDLIVKALDQTINYGETISQGLNMITSTGLVGKDSVASIILTPSTTEVTDSGTITPEVSAIFNRDGDDTMGNYNITYKTGKLVINALDIENATITLDPTSYTYDGNAKKPTVTVIFNNKTLSLNTDYSVSYSNNTNAGTATVTVAGKGNYTGTKNINFTINKKDNTLTVSAKKLTYNTETQSLVNVSDVQGTVYYAVGTELTSSNYSTVGSTTIPSKKNAGSYIVYYYTSGNNNYSEKSGSVTTDIDAYNLSKATIASVSEQTYTGSEIKPTPEVTVPLPSSSNSTKLTNNTDFVYSYSNNINAGEATVTVGGKGNYTGTKSIKFTIIKKANTLSVTAKTLEYTTEDQILVSVSSAQGTVYYAIGTELTSSNYNTKGSTTIPSKKNAGSYTIYYYTGGNDNYQEKSGSVTSKINAYNLSKATIGSVSDQVYTGSEIEPTPEVTVPLPSSSDSTKLTVDTDFTYSYSNNKNVGTATITITGKGNYTGTRSINFKISKNANTLSVTAKTLTYNTNSQALVSVSSAQGTVYYSVGTEITSSNYSSVGSTTIPSKKDAGSYTVYYYTPGNSNYSEKSGSVTSNINAYNLSNAVIATVSNQTYTGNEIEPTPEVTVPIPSSSNSTKLTFDTDFIYSYSNNKDVGTANITIVGKKNYTGTKSINFTISYKTYTITLNNQSATSGGTTKLYGRYADGIYLDSAYTKKMTTSSNNITVPVRTGYAFGGYYTKTNGEGNKLIYVNGYITPAFTSTLFDSDVTLNAKWTAKKLTIVYNRNDGSGSSSSETITWDGDMDDNKFSPPSSFNTRTGYVFSGWSKESDGSDDNRYSFNATVGTTWFLSEVGDNEETTLNLYATWDPKKLTIVYNKNDGSGTSSSETITWDGDMDDNKFSPPSSFNSREGYTFKGWSKKSDGSDNIRYSFNATVGTTWFLSEVGDEEETTLNLYAVWEGNIYSVTLDSQGATTSGTTLVYYQYNTVKTVDGVTCYYYTDSALTKCLTSGYTISKPTKTGYTFRGYFTAENGAGGQYVDGVTGNFINNLYTTIGDHKLYAWLEENIYQINDSSGNFVDYADNLSRALERASAGGTIKVLKDNTSAGTTIDKNITFNTNGKTTTLSSSITNSATTEITGSGTLYYSSGVAISNKGTLTITNSTIKTDYTSVISMSAGTMNVNGGTFVVNASSCSSGCAPFVPSGGTLNINGGTYQGTNLNFLVINGGGTVNFGQTKSLTVSGISIWNNSGTINFKQGVLSGVSNGITLRGGIANISGGSISVTSRNIRNEGGTVNISGGTLSTTSTANVNISSGEINVNGGTFAVNASSCSSGCAPFAPTGGTTNINGGTYQGTNLNYLVINSGGTVNFGQTKSLTVSGFPFWNNSGTINFKQGTLKDVINGITLQGGTANVSGGSITASGQAISANGGETNITGGTLTGAHGILSSSGTVNITGGSIVGSSYEAIYNNGAIVNIGTKDNVVNDVPKLYSSNSLSFNNVSGTWNWYDGVLYGPNSTYNFNSAPSATETGYSAVTVVDATNGYKTYLLKSSDMVYRLYNSSGKITGYAANLSDAITNTSSGGTMLALKDNTSAGVNVHNNVTLNTNGKTITMTGLLVNSDGYTLNIRGNGTITSSSSIAELLYVLGTTNLSDTTLQCTSKDCKKVVLQRGTFNMSSGTISHTDGTAVVSEKGTFKVTGGSIIGSSGSGISVAGGNVNLVTSDKQISVSGLYYGIIVTAVRTSNVDLNISSDLSSRIMIYTTSQENTSSTAISAEAHDESNNYVVTSSIEGATLYSRGHSIINGLYNTMTVTDVVMEGGKIPCHNSGTLYLGYDPTVGHTDESGSANVSIANVDDYAVYNAPGGNIYMGQGTYVYDVRATSSITNDGTKKPFGNEGTIYLNGGRIYYNYGENSSFNNVNGGTVVQSGWSLNTVSSTYTFSYYNKGASYSIRRYSYKKS